MVRRQPHPNWTAIYNDREAMSKEEFATRQVLFVGHGEDAVPTGRRLVEEIFLAALPIGAGWTVIGPLVQNGLEGVLCVLPVSLAVELMGLSKKIGAHTHFVWGAVNRVFGGAADEFVDGHRLELAFHADEIEFAKDEAVVLGGDEGVLVDYDVRAVILVQPFQA